MGTNGELNVSACVSEVVIYQRDYFYAIGVSVG